MGDYWQPFRCEIALALWVARSRSRAAKEKASFNFKGHFVNLSSSPHQRSNLETLKANQLHRKSEPTQKKTASGKSSLFTLLKESNNKSNISYIPLLGSNKEASVRYQHFFIAIPINQKNETLLFSQENTLSEASASSVPTMAYKDMSAGILKLHFLSFAKQEIQRLLSVPTCCNWKCSLFLWDSPKTSLLAVDLINSRNCDVMHFGIFF